MTKALVVAEGIHELSGAVEELISKLTGLRFDITCMQLQDRVVRVHIPHGKFRGFGRRFLGWLSYAEENRFDLLVALVDEDDEPQRHSEAADAQANATFQMPRAFGVAVQAFDAWMLADEQVLSTVFGREVAKIGSPERLKDPKSRFLKLREQHGLTESQRELYRRIAGEIDADRLILSCPKGFAPFANRVRQLFTSLP